METMTRIPEVTLTDANVKCCFDAAARNLVRINTVPCDFSVYNDTGLLNPAVPYMFRAGGSYDTPWTRDAAINTWACGRLLLPRVARNTLLAVCVRDTEGRPIIQPDNQKWDRIVWAVGAWNYYLATGDQAFLAIACGVVERGLEQTGREQFNEEFGLFTGGSFFNDGISGYPADIYEPGMDHSFMGAHPRTEDIMCLSTNCLYCEAYRILARMQALLGQDDSLAMQRHRALRQRILEAFRVDSQDRWGYFLYPDGRLEESLELAGVTFGVLFGILPDRALDSVHEERWGVPSIWPPFPGVSSEERPCRHNNLVWPFLNGFYIQAAAGAGDHCRVTRELEKITRLFTGSDGVFYEIYNPYDGSVDGGWQIGGDDLQGHLWDSCVDQTWSATSYIGAILHGILGIRIGEDGVEVRPSIPVNLADSAVENLQIRDRQFSLRIRGSGSRVASVSVNGQGREEPRISFDEEADRFEIVVTME